MTELLQELRPVGRAPVGGHGLLEGPRFDGARWLYSDVTLGGVWQLREEAEPTPVLARRRGIGGVALHADGGIVVGGRTLQHVTPGGTVRELLSIEGTTGVNDLHVLSDGSLIAGLLRFRPMAGEAPAPGLLVHLRGPDEWHVLDDTLLWPNGIGHSPCGRWLYVSDYAARLVLRLGLDDGERTVLCETAAGSPDGLAVDAHGAVWVALADAAAILRLSPDGAILGRQELPGVFVSSLAFGGTDGREVCVTGMTEHGGQVWLARSDAAGQPSARATA